VPFPKALGNGWLSRFALRVNQALIRLSRSLFSYQIYVEAQTTPTGEFVLGHTREASSASAVSDPERAAALDVAAHR
jgi:hypothetical protein